MIRYRYTAISSPHAAPFVHANLRTPAIEQAIEAADAPAQIDTAADRTVVPGQLVQRLQLVQLRLLEVGGLGGVVTILPTYLVTMQIRGLRPLSVEVVASDAEPWILLGRDVLNQFRILLDGPGQTLEVD